MALYYLISFDYNYYGMLFQPRELLFILLSWVFYFSIITVTPISNKRVSNLIHAIVFALSYVPISVLFELNTSRSFVPFFGISLAYLLIGLAQNIPVYRSFQVAFFNTKSYLLSIGGLLAICLSYLMYAINFTFEMPSLDTIYEQREIFKEEITVLTSYALNWLANSINVVFVIIGLRKRSWRIVLAGVIVAAYAFTLGGHKAILLGIPFLIFIYLFYEWFKRYLVNAYLLLLVAGLAAFFSVDYMTQHVSYISSILVRRGLFLPAQITYNYYEFTGFNPLNYFSQNIPFKYFIQTPYKESIPYLIGREYYSFNEDNHANGNFFADGMINIGLFAFPMVSLFMILFYRLLDFVSIGKPKVVAFSAFFVSITYFINSGIIVSLVTHGLLMTCLLIAFYPQKHRMILASNFKNLEETND